MRLKSVFVIIFFILLSSHELFASDGEGVFITYNNKSYNIHEILSKYIKISSISGNEFKAGEFLKELCKQNGLQITSMGNTNGNYNFAASVYPLEKKLPNIIFLNHIDVVPANKPEEWEYPPFSGEITDHEIWGRGAFDNKGAAVMQLFSIIKIAHRHRSENKNYNVTFLPVSCEETQCEGGIKYVIENYLDLLNPAVVIGEGPPAIKGLIENKPDLAVFGIAVTQKRALWLRLKLELKTIGHSSVTPLHYANKEMIIALNKLLNKKTKIKYNKLNVNLLKRFGELNKGVTGFILKHPKFFKPLITPKLRKEPVLAALFSNTITLTSINDDNEGRNVIPHTATAFLDCRLLPGTSTKKFINYVKRSLGNNNINIEIVKETPQVKASSQETIFYTNMVKAIQQNYKDSKIAAVLLPNANDTYFFRQHGIPSYSTVPVKIDRKYLENIHNQNERIPKDILKKGVDTYTSFVENCFD